MILVAGSLSFDYIFNFPGYFKDQILPDKIHLLNLSFLTEKLSKNFGGTAANISYNLALLGEKSAILASAGRDFTVYKKFLNKAGVKTTYIKTYQSDYTSNYFAIVDKADNQIGVFYSGAMKKAVNLSLKEIEEQIEFMIISPTEPKAMVNFCLECQRDKIPYLFDPGMQLPRISQEQLLKGIAGARILIGNDYEISLMEKKSGQTKRRWLAKGIIVITTLGERGSIIEYQGKKYSVKAAKPSKAVDPVGAGDAYRAGFMFGFLKKYNLKICGQIGALTAVYTVEKYGTSTHRFTKKEFCVRYKKNFNQDLKL